jgi:hypothetical protein
MKLLLVHTILFQVGALLYCQWFLHSKNAGVGTRIIALRLYTLAGDLFKCDHNMLREDHSSFSLILLPNRASEACSNNLPLTPRQLPDVSHSHRTNNLPRIGPVDYPLPRNDAVT